MSNKDDFITVKLSSRAGRKEGGTDLSNQCPGNKPQWGKCRFICNLFAEDYDWLVLVDDFSPLLPGRQELLRCPPSQTLLLTSEPASVTHYGKAFAAQFGYVITNQDETALPHHNAIRSQTGNVWYYGKSYAKLIEEPPPIKTGKLSTVCSAKKQTHTMHARRQEFTLALKKDLPELEIFGRGVRFIEKKYQALDPYRFHLVIENHYGPHVWSEKLADAFLGYTVPIYYGCPNVLDYFPEDSLVQIDINDYAGTLQKIAKLINTPGEYERRLKAVIEARRRVTETYNLASMLSHFIESQSRQTTNKQQIFLRSRKKIRSRNPAELARYLSWHIRKNLR
jgi:hypothetical protein